MGEMRGAVGQPPGRLGMAPPRDQPRRGPNRLFAGDDLQHAIGALVATPWNDVRVDQAGRNVETQSRASPIEKLRGADRSRVHFQYRLVQSAPPTCSPSAIAKNSPYDAIPNIGRPSTPPPPPTSPSV